MRSQGLSDRAIRFLDEEQAIPIGRSTLRDAAQHLIDMSEQMLPAYAGRVHAAARCCVACSWDIADELPTRVLPVSTTPPQDIMSVFGNEMADLALIRPGRRRALAAARLRALAVMDGAIRGEDASDAHLGKLVRAACGHTLA